MRYGKYMRIKGVKRDSFEHTFTKRNFMDQEMEKLIWEYIDGRCNPSWKRICEPAVGRRSCLAKQI